jgi:HK97 family phage major capsid protein
MPAGTDVLIAQYQTELEERETFINQLLEQAQGRDLNEHESELISNATGRMSVLNKLVEPLRETARVTMESRSRMAEIARDLAVARDPKSLERTTVEYRSAGEYLVDYWRAGVGHEDARDRMALYTRAAAHQTTADNLGIIPNPIVGPVLNYIDSSRPLVTVLSPRPVPGGRFTRPRVTQHTQVGEQTAEKTELASRKMIIDSTPVDMNTYGGYVNVSRQNIDWSVPSIMDLVVNDLAAQYAIQTEGVTAGVLSAAATATTGGTIDDTSDAAAVSAALWAAAAAAFSAMPGAGRLVLAVSPDMLGVIGGLFANVNPTNAISQGFQAGDFGSGVMGNVSGITVVMSAAFPAGTALVINTAAAEVYEQRIGALSVTEPSVLGVQVAYAGYFAAIVLTPAGVIDIAA